MKFIHLADVHLGASPDAGKPWGENRGREIWNTFEGVMKSAKAKEVDLVLIAGDLFHRQPLLRELKEVDYLFSRLGNTQVVLIAGNHDCVSVNSYYNTFEWSENVHFIWEKDMTRIRLSLPSCRRPVDIYGFSYHDKTDTRRMYDHVSVVDQDAINILLGHGGDELHCPYSVPLVAKQGFDYVAFGHIHKAGMSETQAVANVGSLEPLDETETGVHGYILGEIDENKHCHMTFYNASYRQYVDTVISVNEASTNGSIQDVLRKKIEQCGSHNIYKVILKGERSGEVEFDQDYLEAMGNVIVSDQTVPNYDLEKLYQENRDNLLGRYIERMLEPGEQMTEKEKKALYYGVHALLDTMEVGN